jgi:hypothetical protein
MSTTTDDTTPRVQLTLTLEEMRDMAKALRWLVLHCGALQGRAAIVEPDNAATREKKAGLLQAWSSADAREVLEQLGEPDLMRRVFVDPPDPMFAVKPEAVRSLARAVLEELQAADDAEDARKEGAQQ